MLVSKWGNSLGVRLPRVLVDNLGLKPGDDLQVVATAPARIEVTKDVRREQAVERMRARGLRLAHDHAFDRDDANAR